MFVGNFFTENALSLSSTLEKKTYSASEGEDTEMFGASRKLKTVWNGLQNSGIHDVIGQSM